MSYFKFKGVSQNYSHNIQRMNFIRTFVTDNTVYNIDMVYLVRSILQQSWSDYLFKLSRVNSLT